MTTNAPMDPKVVRECADMVQIGECITFPNGVTVDKRPLIYPPAQPWVSVPSAVVPTPQKPYPSYLPNTSQGWEALQRREADRG